MRLKALELQGFKSFPDKTVLSFDHPLTAIVGPNGSGKSNISDAIRWVLGEQSARQLRGGKMEDVIFGGTQGRKRQGFAQVSLTLDGMEGVLPDGREEVTVTRRYYRSGESEYYLDSKQVRLRDVNELFMDTGLGQEGYALIGQGKIDEILSAKSTQRREIFEEAAGISHCRHQKEETQRKLERTQENLLRIADKLEELELQREPLKAQAETAQKYLALREELKVLEISLWCDQLDEQRARGDKLRLDHETAQRDLMACTKEADELYARSEELLLQLRDQEAQGETLRARLEETENQLRTGQQRMGLLRGRIDNNQASARRIRGELAEQQTRQTGLEEDIRRQEERLSHLKEQEEACRRDLDQALARQEEAKAARQTALRQSQDILTQCRAKEKQAEDAWMDLRMAESRLADRARLLAEMADHYEGYTKGVKTAMNQARRGNLTGVLGPVGELFRVSARYTVALETALGGAMQNLIVEHEEAGKAVLRLLKKQDGGRVTCLPLTALRPSTLREDGLDREPGFVAVAADLVDCDETCRLAAQSLLGRTVVADTLDHAVALAKKRSYRFPVVTLDGEILRPGGSMTGGSVAHKGGILTRGAEEEELRGKLVQAREALHRGQTALEEARAATRQALLEVEARQDRQALAGDGEVSSLREKLAVLQAEIRAFRPLLDQLAAQRTNAQADRDRREALLTDYDRENESLEQEIARWQDQEKKLAQTREELTAALAQANGEKLRLDRERILADRQARTKNEDQLRLQRETANLEQKRLQATMEENRLLDKLWDTYGVTHQGAQTIRQKITNLSQATRQAGQLREAIRRLGHVNLGAMEEFQRVEERYHYLNDQKTDVETAQRELEIIIQGITEEMREVFLREFTRIQTAFSQTFTDLFGGGQGALALEDEKEVLTCGIDIRVQPPGKTLRTISLLSGGERALVAIALYFAILQVHPTPFCVMDEIEAALDESNGARFIRYLRAMGHSTQFIFITHRRETMEAADLLYGVTMERQGISKILKLDLKQAEELLQTAPKS